LIVLLFLKTMSTSALEQQPALSYQRFGSGVLIAGLLIITGLWNLAGPAMWWDEGWTLSVARNWVERGHYGRLLDGQLAPPGLEASFTVTTPVALAFRLFGIGIWQGRLPGVVFMVAALALLYFLAQRLYDRRVAIGTLFVLLLMPMHPQLHPLIMARQVLGETPMFCYMLAGYTCFFVALRRPLVWLPLATFWWGITVITKAQVVPFWVASLGVPLGVSLFRRQWRTAALLGIGLIGSWMISYPIVWLWSLMINGHTLPVIPISGIYEITALVLIPFNRLFALWIVLLVGLPTLFGLCYAAWRQLRGYDRPAMEGRVETLRLALLTLSGSWFAWFVFLSVGVPRYVYPATFVGSIFVAALLNDITDHYSLQSTLNRATTILRGKLNRQVAGAWLAIGILALTVPITLLTLNNYYFSYTDTSAVDVANFLNTQTPPNALIETYESEVHFLLERRYHYPPDQIHVELNRRSLIHQNVTIDYDPLAANPDYLLVGRFAREDKLYQPVIDSGAFRLLRAYGDYRLYERVR
jgi:hypothetical protein